MFSCLDFDLGKFLVLKMVHFSALEDMWNLSEFIGISLHSLVDDVMSIWAILGSVQFVY